MKTCNKCNKIKELDKYRTYKYKDKLYYANACKKCQYDKSAGWTQSVIDNFESYDKLKNTCPKTGKRIYLEFFKTDGIIYEDYEY